MSASTKTIKLLYCPTARSPQRSALNIPILRKTTTFADVLETALSLLPASTTEDSNNDVFLCEVDKNDWMILESWNGLERCVSWRESPSYLLYKWGQYISQVQFVLRPRKQAKPRKRRKPRRKVRPQGSVKRELQKIRDYGHNLKEFKQIEELLRLQHKLTSVEGQLRTVNEDLERENEELNKEEEIERLRERAQFMKKEAEAKNELNNMQRDKMAEQKALLSKKLEEVLELELQIAQLELVKKERKEKKTTPPQKDNFLSTEGPTKSSMRASICDDGSYLSESLEGKHNLGYHTPPLWARTQSASVVLEGTSPNYSVHGSLRRTPLSSKRRAELAALSRRNSEEGLVLKLVESKRRASIDSDIVLKVSPMPLPQKLDYEEDRSGSDQGNDDTNGGLHSKVKKTKIQITFHQGKVQREEEGDIVSPEIEHTRMPSNLSTSSDEAQKSFKGILKRRKSAVSIPEDEEVPSVGRRIRFDQVAILFSAAIEGEYQLFVETSRKLGSLDYVSYQGVTVLHYSVCSGNMDMVRYIVSRGFDINRADYDGWTPLHCAGSCCNLEILRYLIHNGASLFMKTANDLTPLRVCFEEFEDSLDVDKSSASECLDYLLFAQQELGSINNGVVYALFEYDPREENYTVDDETGLPYLKLKENDKLRVISKGGDQEREEELWWIAETKEKHRGLVPCTLLGSYPKCLVGKK